MTSTSRKNDLDLAQRALEEVPGMRLRRDDFAAVLADWRPKSEQLREVSERLSLGFDSLCFVDDNPAECLEVRRALPQVDVVELPAQPSDRVAALARRPTLEPARLTSADRLRGASYEGLRAARELRARGGSLDDFLADLRMRAVVGRVGDETLDRVAQLVQKTNQFNLTTRRHGLAELRAFMDDPRTVSLTLRLRDRFADHGIVGVAFAELRGDEAVVDTLLLSCRVIGRTAERRLLAELGREAAARGCSTLVGAFRPTDRNAVVADLYPRLGFAAAGATGDEQRYVLALEQLDELETPHLGSGDA